MDIAVGANADGVHLGQTDIPMELARQIFRARSPCGTLDHQSPRTGAGTCRRRRLRRCRANFATPTKPTKAAVGFDYLQYARKHAPLPQFAIGGIDLSNIDDVIQAGATQVAVVRAIMEAADPEATTREFLRRLSQREQS